MSNLRTLEKVSISPAEIKPIHNLDEIYSLVKKLNNRILVLESLLLQSMMTNDLQEKENMSPREAGYEDKIPLPALDYIDFVHPNQILRCISSSNYTNVYLVGGQKILLSKTLKWIEALLPSYFIRIHQSHLVNKHYVTRYHQRGDHYLVMEDGSNVPVSKKGRKVFKNEFRPTLMQ